jgi:hypothetical protein
MASHHESFIQHYEDVTESVEPFTEFTRFTEGRLLRQLLQWRRSRDLEIFLFLRKNPHVRL